MVTGSGIVAGEILTPVVKNSKFGYISSAGKAKTEYIYEEAGEFKEGLARVCLNGNYGYINLEGKIAVNFIYSGGGEFSQGLYL